MESRSQITARITMWRQNTGYNNSDGRKSALVEFLRSDLTKEFPNQDPEPVWKDLEGKMGDYAGKPLFFSSEFGKIDFSKVVKGENIGSLTQISTSQRYSYHPLQYRTTGR